MIYKILIRKLMSALVFASLIVNSGPVFSQPLDFNPPQGWEVKPSVQGRWKGSDGDQYEIGIQDRPVFPTSHEFVAHGLLRNHVIEARIERIFIHPERWSAEHVLITAGEIGAVTEISEGLISPMASKIQIGDLTLTRFEPVGPWSTEDCVLLDPEPFAQRPFVDWRAYWDPSGNLLSKPWEQEGISNEQSDYLYPHAGQGWRLLAYNFGRTYDPLAFDLRNRSQLGYMMFANRYSGLIRTFVRIPSNLQREFGVLVAQIKLTDRNGHPVRNAFAVPNRGEIGSDEALMIWRSDFSLEETLHPGEWLFAEVPTYFLKDFYQGRLEGARVEVSFLGFDESSVFFELAGELSLEGRAIPTIRKTGPDGSEISIAAAGIAASVVGAIYSGQPLDIAGAGLASLAFSIKVLERVFSEDRPDYVVELAGTMSGKGQGMEITRPRGLGSAYFFLGKDNEEQVRRSIRCPSAMCCCYLGEPFL